MKVLAAFVLLAGIVAVSDAQATFSATSLDVLAGGNDCGGCPCSGPNSGRYLITWLLPNCKKFTQDEAINYCQRNGMKAISLETNAKAEETFRLLAANRQRYYWTGGRVNHRDTLSPGPTAKSHETSHSGPKLEEGDEVCVAVLNNFYNDGIRYHDVSCHHTKPTICER
ncbi:Uncharacterized protein FKW44_019377 [Caligus rogercresseyi]|uniref:C-type lectin domain-containing protein n=1 Tax=Caligus rogercresseyi TaxID=217165 RepID=A0A7T8GVT1_CALRO|nr:Uncharacterized protein FKW44_019377 [Caligus rogercresseyi]